MGSISITGLLRFSVPIIVVPQDLPSRGAYYREMCAEQGSGVLVVNYFPSGEVAQMSAKYLKPNQIP